MSHEKHSSILGCVLLVCSEVWNESDEETPEAQSQGALRRNNGCIVTNMNPVCASDL